jgi:hypothetical protein
MKFSDKPGLKLIALDAESLRVISAHLQDAIFNARDMTFLPRERRFAAVANRFDWADALSGGKRPAKSYLRRLTGLRFEQVQAAQVSGINLNDTTAMLSLLAIRFEPLDEPAGFIMLDFAGGGAIRLCVDCIEAEMRDLDAAWVTPRRPRHPDGEGASS